MGNYNSIIVLLMFASLCSFGQNRQDKTIAIIDKLNFVENQKTNFEFQLNSIKYRVIGNDSIKIIEIEKKLTEDQILKRINYVFEEFFTEKEIDDVYNFTKTSAFDKIFNSNEMNKLISANFSDINEEIDRVRNSLEKPIEEPTKNFKPIPVKDKKDGFYAIVDYISTEDKDIKLEDKPSLTSKDILEAKKTYKNASNQFILNLVFTKEGSQKLSLFTKENIGKSIAIVIDNQIISLPKVYGIIMEGKVEINGDFSEEKLDIMIQKLKK